MVARAVLDNENLTLSTQVLQEFYGQGTRPTRPDRLAHEVAAAFEHAVKPDDAVDWVWSLGRGVIRRFLPMEYLETRDETKR